MNPENIIYQDMISQSYHDDGSQLWKFASFWPEVDAEPRWWSTVGTGQYEGVDVEGSWYWNWPDHLEPIGTIEGYDYPNAQELKIIMPADE